MDIGPFFLQDVEVSFTISGMDLFYHRRHDRLVEPRQRHVRWRHHAFLVQIRSLDDERGPRVHSALSVAHGQVFRQL